MRLIKNTGNDRVIDELRSCIAPDSSLDIATPTFSLFAYAEVRSLLEKLDRCRLVIPTMENTNLSMLGSESDRPFRNRLQARWLARNCNDWIQKKAEVRGVPTVLPQSAIIAGHIREALHNCIAHQDYRLGGKINVVEHPDKLVLSNLGVFIPPSIEWMLEHQSPPEHYRNQWLIDGMIRLRMIDQIGSGIRRMFETQRERFFPLPDYSIDPNSQANPRIEVSISGKILDTKYTHVLMKRSDLELRDVILLDRVQKHQKLDQKDARHLRNVKLIEGRSPNYFISAKVADWTGQKARYIQNRGLDDAYYQRLVVEYLHKFKQASRQDLNDLLLPKLSEALTHEQKAHKVRNLIQFLRRDGAITNSGTNKSPLWVLADEEFIAKSLTKKHD